MSTTKAPNFSPNGSRATAVLRPVVLRLVEPRRRDVTRYTITWRGHRGDFSSGQHYRLQDARSMAESCGAAKIIEQEV